MRLHRLRARPLLAAFLAAAALAAWGNTARAGMQLTAAGMSAGFSLSTFADSFTNNGIGPVGIGFAPSGNVLVTDYYTGHIYSFADVDGQHASGANVLPGSDGGNNWAGLATLGNTMYMAEQATGTVVTVNPANGGTASIPNVPNGAIPAATDVLADPTNGVLYVSALGNGIYKISNLGGTPVVTHFSGVAADGISISTDGSTIYADSNGQLVAVSTSTGLITRNYGGVGNGLDGTALGTGTLAGNIFANTNGGQIIEVDLTTGQQTLIAQGGSRGDLVKVDPNGTLLLTQSDSVLRLTAPSGGGFGTVVPEPSTFLSSAVAALMGLGYGWHRRKAKRAD